MEELKENNEERKRREEAGINGNVQRQGVGEGREGQLIATQTQQNLSGNQPAQGSGADAQANTDQNSNVTSPFNQKYLSGWPVESATPAANRRLEAPVNLDASKKSPQASHTPSDQLQHNQSQAAHQGKLLVNDLRDTMQADDDKLANPREEEPAQVEYGDLDKEGNPLENASRSDEYRNSDGEGDEGDRKSQKPLNGGGFQELKDKIALVRRQLPENMQARRSAQGRAPPQPTRGKRGPPQAPVRKDYSTSVGRRGASRGPMNRGSSNKATSPALGARKPTDQPSTQLSSKPMPSKTDKARAPGANQQWLTQPLNALAAQRRVSTKAQKLFVPKRPNRLKNAKKNQVAAGGEERILQSGKIRSTDGRPPGKPGQTNQAKMQEQEAIRRSPGSKEQLGDAGAKLDGGNKLEMAPEVNEDADNLEEPERALLSYFQAKREANQIRNGNKEGRATNSQGQRPQAENKRYHQADLLAPQPKEPDLRQRVSASNSDDKAGMSPPRNQQEAQHIDQDSQKGESLEVDEAPVPNIPSGKQGQPASENEGEALDQVQGQNNEAAQGADGKEEDQAEISPIKAPPQPKQEDGSEGSGAGPSPGHELPEGGPPLIATLTSNYDQAEHARGSPSDDAIESAEEGVSLDVEQKLNDAIGDLGLPKQMAEAAGGGEEKAIQDQGRKPNEQISRNDNDEDNASGPPDTENQALSQQEASERAPQQMIRGKSAGMVAQQSKIGGAPLLADSEIEDQMSQPRQQSKQVEYRYQELLMKYRIESDDHRDRRQGPPGVIGAAENLRSPESQLELKATLSSKFTTAAKDQKPQRALFKPMFGTQTREGNQQVVVDARTGLLTVGPVEQMSPDKLKQFLERQAAHEGRRRHRLAQVKEREDSKAARDLKFQPNAGKSRHSGGRSASTGKLRVQDDGKTPTRSLTQFLRDQERFKRDAEKRIEVVRQQKLQEEAGLLQGRPRISTKSRAILKQFNKDPYDSQRGSSRRKRPRHGSQSSNLTSPSPDAMDEGTRALGRGADQAGSSLRRRSMNASFDDIDEHPNRKGLPPSSQLIRGPPSSPSSRAESPRGQPPLLGLPFKQFFSPAQAEHDAEYLRAVDFEGNSKLLEQPRIIGPSKMMPESSSQKTNQPQRVRALSGSIINIHNDEVNQQYFKTANAVPQSNEARSQRATAKNDRTPPQMVGTSTPSQYPNLNRREIAKIEIFESGSESGKSVGRQPGYLASTKSSRRKVQGDGPKEEQPENLRRTASADIYYRGDFLRQNILGAKHAADTRRSSSKRRPAHQAGRLDKRLDSEKKASASRSPGKAPLPASPSQPTARQANPNSYQNATNDPPAKLTSKNTEKIVLQKFNKEFTRTLQKILNKDKLLPAMIDSYTFTQLMMALGVARQVDMESNRSQEFKKVEEVWLYLLRCAQHPQANKSLRKQAISVGDTKLFLMATFGIRGNKRLGQDDRGLIELQNQQNPDNQLPYGWFNRDGRLCLTEQCAERIRSKFSLMNSNRINHLGKILDEKKEREHKARRFDFQPNLAATKMSNQILNNQKKRTKNNDDESATTTAATALRARSVSKDYKLFAESHSQWRQSESHKKAKKEIQECTFQPNIHRSSRKYRNASTTYLPAHQLTANLQLMTAQAPPEAPQTPINSSNLQKQQENVNLKEPSGTQENDTAQPAQNWAKLSRFDQLFSLSKVQAHKKSLFSSKSQDQREFETQRQECTFKPRMVAKQMPPASKALGRPSQKQTINQPKRDSGLDDSSRNKHKEQDPAGKLQEGEEGERERRERQKIKEKVRHLRDKSQKRDIERRQQGAKERDYINECKAAGKHAKALQRPKQAHEATDASHRPNPAELTPQGALSKIRGVTKRLGASKPSEKQALSKPAPRLRAAPPTSQAKKQKIQGSARFEAKQPVKNADIVGDGKGNGTRPQNMGAPAKRNVGAKAEGASPQLRQLQEQEAKPLLYIDVDTGEDQKDRITVYKGDSARLLAEEFCQKHGFDLDTQETLLRQLQAKIDKVAAMISNPENPNSTQGSNQKRSTNVRFDDYRNPDPEEAEGSNPPGVQRGLGGQLQQIPESETRCEQGDSSDRSDHNNRSDNEDANPAGLQDHPPEQADSEHADTRNDRGEPDPGSAESAKLAGQASPAHGSEIAYEESSATGESAASNQDDKKMN